MVRPKFTMIYCHVCHKPMSAEAPVCATCGQPNPYAKAIKNVNNKYKYIVLHIIALLLCAVCIYCTYNYLDLIKLYETITYIGIEEDIRSWQIRIIVSGVLALIVEICVMFARSKNKKYFNELGEWYQDNHLFVPPDQQYAIYK